MRGDRSQARFITRLVAALATVLLLAAGRATAAEDPEALKAEAFEAAQWAMSSETAAALARVSARFAEGGGPLASLADRRERLTQQKSSLERELESLYAQSGPDAAARREEVRKRLEAAGADLTALDAQIAKSFPDFADLINPQPLSLAQTQALLGPDEALLLVLVADDAAYAWGVTRDGATWARADGYGAAAVGQDVRRLRAYLAGSVGGGDHFDRETAARLYARLIQPVEGAFQGKRTLIAVTGGALASLPLGVLVTQADGSGSWLIDRYAIAALPAVSSLRSLRCFRAVGPPPQGCPAGSGASRGAAPAQRRELVGFGAPAGLRPAEEVEGRGATPVVQNIYRGGLADPASLRELASLPGSAEELSALKALYPSSLVRMGKDATETAVRSEFADDLANSRYVVLSTHGLMAGQMGAAEPGLVLTPPDTPSEADDGYLTASEAAQLRLSADLVVLSACNTAASDGTPGAEGLSGLARAFFFAGARSVLVSHWEVSDAATVLLMKSAFADLEGRDVGRRARALQHAAQAVRADPRFADPQFWAAFTLVGEPER